MQGWSAKLSRQEKGDWGLSIVAMLMGIVVAIAAAVVLVALYLAFVSWRIARRAEAAVIHEVSEDRSEETGPQG